MSATEIIQELPRLSEAERRAVFLKLRELAGKDADANAAEDQGLATTRLEEAPTPYRIVNLRDRGIGEAQAADLRARLKTFAEDWERPEAAIYDETQRGDVVGIHGQPARRGLMANDEFLDDNPVLKRMILP